MGMQLAYGGSGSAPWEDASDNVAALDAENSLEDADADSAENPTQVVPGTESEVDSLINHIIEAIEAQDRRPIPGAATTYTPTSVRPARHVGTTGVSSSNSRFISTPRSGRSATQSVARGAAAVAAGAALRRGDAEALRELGLDLETLKRLSPREQQQRILDEILGAPGHPDDEALRRAAHATLKAMAQDVDMTQDSQIDYLLGSYVYEQALVELTSQHANRELSRDALKRLDQRLKPYIFKKARRMVTGPSRYLSPALFIEKASSLVSTIFAVLRSDS